MIYIKRRDTHLLLSNEDLKDDHASHVALIGVVDVGRVGFAHDVDGGVARQRLETHEDERRQVARLVGVRKVFDMNAAYVGARQARVVVERADQLLVERTLTLTSNVYVAPGVLVAQLCPIERKRWLGARHRQPAVDAIELERHTRRARRVAVAVLARARSVGDDVVVVEGDRQRRRLLLLAERSNGEVGVLEAPVTSEEDVERVRHVLGVVGVEEDERALRIGLRTKAETGIDHFEAHHALRVVVGGRERVHLATPHPQPGAEERGEAQIEEAKVERVLEPAGRVAAEQLAVLFVVGELEEHAQQLAEVPAQLGPIRLGFVVNVNVNVVVRRRRRQRLGRDDGRDSTASANNCHCAPLVAAAACAEPDGAGGLSLLHHSATSAGV